MDVDGGNGHPPLEPDDDAVDRVRGPLDPSGLPPWYPHAVAIAILGVLAALLLIRFFGVISWVLSALVLALFASFALEPPVNWFVRKGWRRGTSTGAVLAILVVTVVLFLAAMLPSLVEQLAAFFGALPDYLDRSADALGVETNVDTISAEALETRQQLLEFGAHTLTAIVDLSAALFGVIGRLFTIGLIAFYLVAEGPKFRRTVCSLLPRRRQREVLRVWEISIEKMGGYLYSRLILAIASGAGVYVVLRLLGVPYAGTLALFQGFISAFVPIIGTYIALAAPVTVALLTVGRAEALLLLAYEILYQQFENYILSPKVSAKRMQLHPAVAFVVGLIGGAVGGLIGAFLALPIGAIFQAVASTIIRRHEVIEDELTREPDPIRRSRREDPAGAPLARMRRWVGSLGGSER